MPPRSILAGWIAPAILAVIAIVALSQPAPARSLRHLNPTPFSHSPCSVLDDRPCAPYSCSVLERGPCIPEIDYPTGQNLQLTIESKPDDSDTQKYQKPDHALGTISDLFAALRSCWTPPQVSDARSGMQMSVTLSFKRSGDLIAPPRMTYASDGISADLRKTYLGSITDALAHCAPLSLSKSLAGAIAGRPIMVRYVDNRALKD